MISHSFESNINGADLLYVSSIVATLGASWHSRRNGISDKTIIAQSIIRSIRNMEFPQTSSRVPKPVFRLLMMMH